MNSLSNTVVKGLVSSYQNSLQRVHSLAATLSEEQFWARPYAYGNSFGHLVLHVTGNLSYYIGTEIAGTGYERDRPREFTDNEPPSKAEALENLDAAVKLTIDAIGNQSDDDWSLPFVAAGASASMNDRCSAYLKCAVHFHHHVGQQIYLEKEFGK